MSRLERSTTPVASPMKRAYFPFMGSPDTDHAMPAAHDAVHPETSAGAGEESHDMWPTTSHDRCDGGTDLYDVDEEYDK